MVLPSLFRCVSIISCLVMCSHGTTDALSNFSNFKKSTCLEREPCGVLFGNRLLTLCQCGGSAKCPTEFDGKKSMMVSGSRYQFCESAKLEPCDNGQLSSIIQGYKREIFCLCPRPMNNVAKHWNTVTDVTEYICRKLPKCSSDGICASRTIVNTKLASDKEPTPVVRSHFAQLCRCEMGNCRETSRILTSNQNNTQLHVFKCL